MRSPAAFPGHPIAGAPPVFAQINHVLTKIREKIQGILAVFVVSLLAVPFVLWGIGSYFEGGSSVAVAEVNGVEISQRLYRQHLDELRRTNVQQAESGMLKELVLENLIGQTLLLVQAQENGYRVSDADLARVIHALPYFQTDGRFDPRLYQSSLRRQGMTPAEFEDQLRRDILPHQLQQGLRQSAFVTEADVAQAIRLLRQEREVAYAVIDAGAFLDEVSVDPKEIEDYYRANRESFRAPEAVRVAYITLKASDLGRGMEASEEELRRAYEADAARYVAPERRRISHILIEVPSGADGDAAGPARAKMEALLKELRAGADFAALAKEHSDDPASAAKGGDLGEVSRGVLPAELEEAVFALEPGEVSEPVRTGFGYHLAKLTDYIPEQRRPYEAVKEELAERVRERKAQEEFYVLAERFRNLVYEHPRDLETAAEALGLEVQTSDWFTREGGAGVAADSRVVEAAFEPEVLHDGWNSDAIELDRETLVAVRVADHRPSEIRPLAEVRSEIEGLLKAERTRERAGETAAAWVAKLEQGRNLRELADGSGVASYASETVTREQPGGIEGPLAGAVFAAPRPEGEPVIGQVDLGARGHAVYALEAVRDADPDSADAELEQRVRGQVLQRRGMDYYLSYREGLRETADVTVNADQL